MLDSRIKKDSKKLSLFQTDWFEAFLSFYELFSDHFFHIPGSFSADILWPCSGTDKRSFPYSFYRQTYGNRNFFQMHPDQRISDIHSCISPDMLNRYRVLHLVPYGSRKRTSCMCPWPDIDYFIESVMDDDRAEDIYEYFRESESDSIDDAIDELGDDYSEEEIRLVRIKFISEMGN